MVMEDSPNGLMKFGCSYILTVGHVLQQCLMNYDDLEIVPVHRLPITVLQVLAQPAQQGESGTHESIAPSC